MNNNPKAMAKMIEDQQEVIRHLNQEVMTLSKSFTRTRMTQVLLLSILMKYDPKLLVFFEKEVQRLEDEPGVDLVNMSEIIQLKKVLSDIKKIANKSKAVPE